MKSAVFVDYIVYELFGSTILGAKLRRFTNKSAGKELFVTSLFNVLLITASVVYVALLSQVAFPLPFTPVMISLGTFAVLTVSAALGAERAVFALALYALLGFCGAPVFQGWKAGIGLPTMGYIVGYIFAALFIGRIAERQGDRKLLTSVVTMLVANIILYIPGIAWLMYVVKTSSIVTGLQLGLIPFILGDLFKIAIASGLLPGLWKVTQWIESKRKD